MYGIMGKSVVMDGWIYGWILWAAVSSTGLMERLVVVVVVVVCVVRPCRIVFLSFLMGWLLVLLLLGFLGVVLVGVFWLGMGMGMGFCGDRGMDGDGDGYGYLISNTPLFTSNYGFV